MAVSIPEYPPSPEDVGEDQANGVWEEAKRNAYKLVAEDGAVEGGGAADQAVIDGINQSLKALAARPGLLANETIFRSFLAIFDANHTEHIAKVVTAAASSCKYAVDKHNEQRVVHFQSQIERQAKRMKIAKASGISVKDLPVPEGDYRASNDRTFNEARLRPGQLIRVWIPERMRSTQIDFTHKDFASSATGPIINKSYVCLIRFMTPMGISVHVLTSKNRTGFQSINSRDYDKFVPVFASAKASQSRSSVRNALFTEGREECQGSMICLKEHIVDWNEYIMLEDGRFLPESIVRIHDLVLEDKHTKSHIGSLLEGCGITDDMANHYRVMAASGHPAELNDAEPDAVLPPLLASPAPPHISSTRLPDRPLGNTGQRDKDKNRSFFAPNNADKRVSKSGRPQSTKPSASKAKHWAPNWVKNDSRRQENRSTGDSQSSTTMSRAESDDTRSRASGYTTARTENTFFRHVRETFSSMGQSRKRPDIDAPERKYPGTDLKY